MTKLEKIDLIKKLDPSYQETSEIFSYSETKINKIIKKLAPAIAEMELELTNLRKEIFRLKNEKAILSAQTNDDTADNLKHQNYLLKNENKKLRTDNAKFKDLLKGLKSILKNFETKAE